MKSEKCQGVDLLRFERDLWRQGLESIAGVDEAGRGPLAGPVVAAAVVFPPYLQETFGIQDSKRLSAKKRSKIFTIIYDKALAVGVGIVEHDVIDQVNILNATLQAMKQALAAITFPLDYVLIDGNIAPKIVWPCQTIVKGDSLSLSIAAASIIAKVTRDDLMMQWHEKYPVYNFARHKGYPTRFHIEAIRRHGLSPIHRRSFHPKALRDLC